MIKPSIDIDKIIPINQVAMTRNGSTGSITPSPSPSPIVEDGLLILNSNGFLKLNSGGFLKLNS